MVLGREGCPRTISPAAYICSFRNSVLFISGHHVFSQWSILFHLLAVYTFGILISVLSPILFSDLSQSLHGTGTYIAHFFLTSPPHPTSTPPARSRQPAALMLNHSPRFHHSVLLLREPLNSLVSYHRKDNVRALQRHAIKPARMVGPLPHQHHSGTKAEETQRLR